MSISFDEDYFEYGIELGISNYENYHWLGKPTLDYCKAVKNFLKLENGSTLLDFGCAKGFYTKGFRLHGIDAWGSDVSEYAIDNCDPDIRDWVTLVEDNEVWSSSNMYFDWCFCKDVLEHLEELDETLLKISQRCKKAFFGIPLAKDGKFRIERAGKDKTHIYCKDNCWWFDKISSYFDNVIAGFRIDGIEHRLGDHPHGYIHIVAEN